MCQHRLLHCIDPGDGKLRWQKELGNERNIYGRLVATEDYFFVGGWRGYTPLYCLASNTGTEIWHTPERRNYAQAIAGPWGIALHDIEANTLLIVDPLTGDLRNRLPLLNGTKSSDRRSSVQRYGSALLTTTRQGDILILDPVKDQQWRALGFHSARISTIQPTILDDWLLFADRDERLCIYDLSAGRLLWSEAIVHHHGQIPAIRIAQKQLIIGTSEGQLLLLDDRGHRLASQTVGKRITTILGSAQPGTIIFGTTGALTCYEID